MAILGQCWVKRQKESPKTLKNQGSRGFWYYSHSIVPVAMSIIDMMIDLYEYKLGDGWKTDDGFLFLLKNVDYYGGDIVAPSVRSESQALFTGTKEWNSDFVAEMTKDIPEKPVPDWNAVPYMKDGKIRMGCSADMTDPVTGEAFYGTISWVPNLKTGTREAYYITDYRDAAEKYFR